ncbi:MAG TPA: hypothetical protein DCE07_00405 [Peptococcaceae bacterium]|nr:hypothetical protein [Peptococcaceae bacterium]
MKNRREKKSGAALVRRGSGVRFPAIKGSTIAFRASLLYAGFASFYIYFSDRLLARFVPDPVLLARAKTYNYGAFVAVTAVLFWFVVRYWLKELQDSQEARLAAESRKWELEEHLERYLAVSPTITYALKVEGKTTRLLWVSENIEHILGYTPKEALRPNFWSKHVHPEDREQILDTLSLLSEKGSLVQEYCFLRKDRTMIWMRDEVRLVKSPNGTEQEIVGSWTDVTDRKEAENKLVKQRKMLERLNELSRFLGEDMTLDQSLEKGLQILLSLSFSRLLQRGGSFLVDPEKEELVPKYSFNLPEVLQRTCARVPFGYCLCGRAAATGQMQYADYIDDRHENRYPGIEPHEHYCVPIVTRERVLGVIVLYLPEKYPADPLEKKFLLSAAEIFAALVNRKEAETQIQDSCAS